MVIYPDLVDLASGVNPNPVTKYVPSCTSMLGYGRFEEIVWDNACV